MGYDERAARKLVSRGQQKLLASAMILAATETVQAQLERPLLLLLDDPAAELDETSVERLMHSVAVCDARLWRHHWIRTRCRYRPGARLFHVEHGKIRAEN